MTKSPLDVPDSPPADLLVAIATYNERDNLPGLVAEIFSRLPDCHVLVIDDNSPDGTGTWCDEYASHDPRLRCHHRPGKLGLGTATIHGLQFACHEGYRLVVTMDADFSHDPRHLPEIVDAMDDVRRGPFDVVIGSRYVAGGAIVGWPWHRRWMSQVLNRFARYWLQLVAHDTSGAYRCYRTRLLRCIDLQQIRARGYAVFEELLWVLQQSGARFDERPITFVDRRRGQSKISLREALSSVWHLLQLPWS